MLNRSLIGLTLLCFSLLGVALWHQLNQPVRKFVVSGDLSALERQKVEQQLMLHEIGGILSVDLDDVKLRLGELSWAREISVRRVWPNQLKVTLTRARPIARWGEGQYVSAAGELLELPDSYAGLPQFDVAVSEPAQALEVYRLLDQAAARQQLQIRRLQQNRQGEWQIVFDNGLQARLGAQQLMARMRRVLIAHREILDRGDQAASKIASYIDARYGNGVAVGFQEDEKEAEKVAQQDADKEDQQPLLVAR